MRIQWGYREDTVGYSEDTVGIQWDTECYTSYSSLGYLSGKRKPS